jgi:hypothetical protein
VKQLYAILLLGITALILSWAISALVRNTIADHHWQAVSRYAFPMYFTLAEHDDTGCLQPAFKVNFGRALFISHLMFFAYLFVMRRRGVKPPPLLRLANATAIILFGVPGLIAIFVLNKSTNKKR